MVFQVYTAFRGVFRPGRLCRHLMDALFALVMLSAVSVAMFIVNWGELRLYVPLSLASGFLISNFLMGDITYGAAYRYFRLVKKGAGWAKRNVVVPSGRFLADAGAKAKRWIVPEMPLPPTQDETPPQEPPEGNVAPSGNPITPKTPPPKSL